MLVEFPAVVEYQFMKLLVTLFCRAAASSNLSMNGTRQPVSRRLQGKPRATGRAPVSLALGPTVDRRRQPHVVEEMKMESQILSSLVEIKVALYWLIAILSVGVFASSIRAGLALRSAVRREKADRVSREAGDLYDDGKLEEVLAYCDDELKTRPKDPYAMWYKAKAL